MKKFSQLTVLFIFISLLSFSFQAIAYEKVDKKTIEFTKDGKISLSNISGDIVIYTWKDAKVLIETKKIGASEEDINRISMKIRRKSKKALKIETDYSNSKYSRRNGASIDFKLTVPETVKLKLHSISGDVAVSNLKAPLEINLVSGDIKLENIESKIESETISGNVFAKKVNDHIELQTISGEIHIYKCFGDIKLETISGNIKIDEAYKRNDIEANTVNGNIIFNGTINSSDDYDFNTTSGDIRFFIPDNSNFEIKANSFSGDIKCDFKPSSVKVTERNRLKAIIGKNTSEIPELKLNTFSGNIKVIEK